LKTKQGDSGANNLKAQILCTDLAKWIWEAFLQETETCQFATGKNCYSKACSRPECEGEQQMKNDGDQIQCTVEWIILQSPVCNQEK
jgi:hypothetical protein